MTVLTDTPAPPEHLSEPAADLWREVLAEFDPGEAELRLLQVACEAFDACQAAREVVAVEGVSLTDRFGQTKLNPLVPEERQQRDSFVRALSRLGVLDREEFPGA